MSALNGKFRVGVMLGGISNEREVSLRSGEAVYQALRSRGIPAVKIDPASSLVRALRRHPIRTAFLALHGRGGEDGAIQRELKRRGICYTGSSAEASRLAFDKHLAKSVLARRGIPTPRWVVVNRKNLRARLSKLRFPVFSKPVRDGSSIGVHQVESVEEFIRRSGRLFAHESRLLVEEKIEGRELTVGILGRRALPPVELRPKGEFYDYVSKYTRGMTEYLVPAPLAPDLARRVQRTALRAHRALGLRDFSRVDIILDGEGTPFVLELNTLPGFTSLSLFPKAAHAAGLSFEDLCLCLLRMAEKRVGHGAKN